MCMGTVLAQLCSNGPMQERCWRSSPPEPLSCRMIHRLQRADRILGAHTVSEELLQHAGELFLEGAQHRNSSICAFHRCVSKLLCLWSLLPAEVRSGRTRASLVQGNGGAGQIANDDGTCCVTVSCVNTGTLRHALQKFKLVSVGLDFTLFPCTMTATLPELLWCPCK